MKPVQEMSPEHELILTAQKIFGSPKPSDADLIDTSETTDAALDESANEDADCTPYCARIINNREHFESALFPFLHDLLIAPIYFIVSHATRRQGTALCTRLLLHILMIRLLLHILIKSYCMFRS